MERRTFFGWIAGVLSLVAGCWSRSRAPVDPELAAYDAELQEFDFSLRPNVTAVAEPSSIDPYDRMIEAFQRELSGDAASGDPITLFIIASVIGAVLKYCVAHAAVRIQRSVRARPEGASAVRLRGKIETQLRQAEDADGIHLFSHPAAIKQHVDTVFNAFINARPDDVLTLVNDLREALPRHTGSAELRRRNTAHEWSLLE